MAQSKLRLTLQSVKQSFKTVFQQLNSGSRQQYRDSGPKRYFVNGKYEREVTLRRRLYKVSDENPDFKNFEYIRPLINWGKFSNKIFGRTSTWFYSKFNGSDSHGYPCSFTPGEKAILKEGLINFAEEIKRAADTL